MPVLRLLPLLRPRSHRHFHTTPAPRILESTLTATHTLFTTLHTTTALSWSTLIPLTAILLRAAITTPTTIYSRRTALKALSLQPLISAWQHPLSRAAKQTTTTPQEWESKTRTSVRKKRAEILRRHNCQRWKSFAPPFLQLPVWIVASVTLRGMSGREGAPGWLRRWWNGTEAGVVEGSTGGEVVEKLIPIEPSFANEGALWFQNLLLADPEMILPLSFSLLMTANILMQSRVHPPTNRNQRIFTRSLMLIPAAAFPMIINMPAALTLYWATSSAYSLVQNMILYKTMPKPEEVEPCKVKDPYKIPEI